MEIFCLLVAGGPIREDIGDELFYVARQMIREGKKRELLNDPEFEGEIQTELRHTCIGGVSGVVFTANVEYGDKKVRVRYIVRSSDLETDDREVGWQWHAGPSPGFSMN